MAMAMAETETEIKSWVGVSGCTEDCKSMDNSHWSVETVNEREKVCSNMILQYEVPYEQPNCVDPVYCGTT